MGGIFGKLRLDEITGREKIGQPAISRPSSSSPSGTATSAGGAVAGQREQIAVQNVFGARPLNATDLLKAGGVEDYGGNVLNTTDTGTFSWVVPQGRVAIVTGFSWDLNPIFAAPTLLSVVGVITIDGQPVPHLDVFGGQNSLGALVPAYFAADQGQTVAITITRSSVLSIADRIAIQPDFLFTLSFYSLFVGTMLQREGYALNFAGLGRS